MWDCDPGIMVDDVGNRFVDETALPNPGAKILSLPGKSCLKIFGSHTYEKIRQSLPLLIQGDVIERADNAEGLAERLGVNARVLADTVVAYNNAVGTEDHFGRQISVPLTSPLFGFRVYVALYSTHCGLKVNLNAQVVRADGSVIDNLYAGGDTSEGVCGPAPEGYLPGDGMLAAVGLEEIAGDHAGNLVVRAKRLSRARASRRLLPRALVGDSCGSRLPLLLPMCRVRFQPSLPDELRG